jgi:3-isopropylmalate/(R)-2-methylmalate dehydratase small subunit
MTTIHYGRAFVFGDNIDTDVLAPGTLMKLGPHELARHCLEAIDPTFAAQVQPGDFVIAGRNFGMGSSREQAAVSLKLLGVRAVIAQSFARIFYRNAINLGLPAITLAAEPAIQSGDLLDLDVSDGILINVTQSTRHEFSAIPAHLMAMINDGGLMPHLIKKFQSRSILT